MAGLMMLLAPLAPLAPLARLHTRRRDDRGASAVDWLIIVGVTIAIATFAGEAVFNFVRSLAGNLSP